MSQEAFLSYPNELLLREIVVQICTKGFRSKTKIIVTTLLDAREYREAEIADLYRDRWHIELDFRSLKTSMSMEVLRCKTPAMIRKEIYTYFIAYNLVRSAMCLASRLYATQPRLISFKGTLQFIRSFINRFLYRDLDYHDWFFRMIEAIGTHRVGARPDRIEPREVKRRPKPYPLLTKPRNERRKQLVQKS